MQVIVMQQVIGDVRVYDYSQKTSSGIAVTTFDLRFYDMQLYTVLTIANNISTGIDSHVKGKFSGCSWICSCSSNKCNFNNSS